VEELFDGVRRDCVDCTADLGGPLLLTATEKAVVR
jgi:hypothetical protein